MFWILFAFLIVGCCCNTTLSCSIKHNGSLSDIILDAWQSSSHVEEYSFCFNKSARADNQFNFVHTASQPADDGYQWFMVQLKQPILISEVGLLTRDYAEHNHAANRAANVQLWTLDEQPYFLKNTSDIDRCRTSFMSTFSKNNWSYCSATPDNMSPLSLTKLTCNHKRWVHFLLLMKPVANVSTCAGNSHCLNFQNLTIFVVPHQLLSAPTWSPAVVYQNDDVLLSCTKPSLPSAVCQVELCHTTGTSSENQVICYKNANLKIDKLDVRFHLRNYSCQYLSWNNSRTKPVTLPIYYPVYNYSISNFKLSSNKYLSFTFEYRDGNPPSKVDCSLYFNSSVDGKQLVPFEVNKFTKSPYSFVSISYQISFMKKLSNRFGLAKLYCLFNQTGVFVKQYDSYIAIVIDEKYVDIFDWSKLSERGKISLAVGVFLLTIIIGLLLAVLCISMITCMRTSSDVRTAAVLSAHTLSQSTATLGRDSRSKLPDIPPPFSSDSYKQRCATTPLATVGSGKGTLGESSNGSTTIEFNRLNSAYLQVMESSRSTSPATQMVSGIFSPTILQQDDIIISGHNSQSAIQGLPTFTSPTEYDTIQYDDDKSDMLPPQNTPV